MHPDTLVKGNELQTKINAAKIQLKKWNDAAAFPSNGILINYSSNGAGKSDYLRTNHIDFQNLKTVVSNKIQQEIDQLQREFDSL